MKPVMMAASLLALAACGESKPAEITAVPQLSPPPAVKLITLDCGRFHTKDAAAFSDEHVYDGQERDLVDPCYLVRHEKGDRIWDTGIPAAVAAAGGGNTGFTATLEKTIEQQLTELGLAPADIEFVSFSHSHFDHVGNGNLFAGSTWIADKDERDAMFSEAARKDPNFAAYSALENAKTILIRGDRDYDVFGDGSAVIVQTPGHTPGHTVLLLKTQGSGNLILSGDMWHLAEAREKRTVPTFNFDRAKTLASMDKVEALAVANSAKIIRQHVPEDFDALPKFPAALE